MTDTPPALAAETLSDKRTLSVESDPGPQSKQVQYSSDLLDDLASEYLRAAYAENTRRAYAADLKHFIGWGGTIPSSPHEIARYLTGHAQTLGTRTLRRRLAAIANAHLGHPEDPTKSPVIARLMRGISRRCEQPPRQARPLLLTDLARICVGLCDSFRDIRDKTILLIGFFAALRRSEIAALDWQDVEVRPDGLCITIRRSKTDQSGLGRQVHVPTRGETLCPIQSLKRWGNCARSPTRLFTNESGQGLSDRAIARIIQQRAERAGLDGTYTGHSLRSGYATSAALSGIEATLIARQTGHRSLQSVLTYIRPNARRCTETQPIQSYEQAICAEAPNIEKPPHFCSRR